MLGGAACDGSETVEGWWYNGVWYNCGFQVAQHTARLENVDIQAQSGFTIRHTQGLLCNNVKLNGSLLTAPGSPETSDNAAAPPLSRLIKAPTANYKVAAPGHLPCPAPIQPQTFQINCFFKAAPSNHNW